MILKAGACLAGGTHAHRVASGVAHVHSLIDALLPLSPPLLQPCTLLLRDLQMANTTNPTFPFDFDVNLPHFTFSLPRDLDIPMGHVIRRPLYQVQNDYLLYQRLVYEPIPGVPRQRETPWRAAWLAMVL